MTYSVDVAYMEYFKCAADGKYDSGFFMDRLMVTAISTGSTFFGLLRIVGRVINLINEIVKVVFYTFASLFTLGKHGNKERLKDHCKLLLLNTAGFAAQSIQISIYALVIIVGITNPKEANRIMQIATKPIARITSYENEIYHQYKTPKILEKIEHKIAHIFDDYKEHIKLKATAAYLVYELDFIIDAALLFPLGFMHRFHLHSANPVTLTEEQKKLTPILLLHGNGAHQATWLALLHAMEKLENKRPVYTLNLPRDCTDTTSIRDKITSMKEQYQGDDAFEVDLIGHSMGSNLIQNLSRNWLQPHELQPNENGTWMHTLPLNFKINRAITAGTPFYYGNEEKCRKIVNITGTKDLIAEIFGSIAAKYERGIEINTGHSGLIAHPDGLRAILRSLDLVDS